MVGVFVLGPSRWRDADNVASALATTPLEARRQVAEVGSRSFGVDAFVMEDQHARKGEKHTELFRRLVVERDVQAFLILMPMGCRLHGTEKEFGALLEWLANGWLSGDQVFTLAEAATWEESEDGAMGSLNEPGNRTRYHEDLLAYDARIRLWDDENALIGHAIGAFGEIRTAPTMPWYEPIAVR